MTSPILQAAPLRRLLSLLVLAATLAVPAAATTYTVDSTSDAPSMTTNTPDGVLTLREALIAANSDAPYGDAAAGTGDDTIQFDFAPQLAGGFTITLLQGELAVTDGVVIDGSGAPGLVITTPTNIPRRLFNVTTTDVVLFADIGLTGGFAPTGGAILLGAGGNLVLSNADFEGNRADDGGALYVSAGASVNLGSGTSFTGNRANGSASTNGGGAIYTAGEVNSDAFDSVSFDGNRATVGAGSGGAIFVADGGAVSTLLIDATATAPDARGGGFFFSNNRAARAGGAIEVREGGSVEMTFAGFTENLAGPNPGNGGAVHITGAGAARFDNGIFVDNVASAEGGALWNSGSGTLAVEDTDFFSNRARGTDADQGGGAIFSDGGDTSVMGGSFVDNSAVDGSGSGGAIFSNGALFTIENADIGGGGGPMARGANGNRSARAGGGIEVRGGTMTIDGSSINNNSTSNSPGNGGGLHISGDGDVTITDSEVTDNFAHNEGGGLWNFATGTLTVVATTIDGNSTNGNGGGLFQQDGDDASGQLTVSNSVVSNNSARVFGGGLFADGATTVVQNSTLSGNNARRGGGGMSTGATVSFQSATIAANAAVGVGGGFSNPDSDNRVQLQNTLVADNTANGAPQQLSGFYASMGNNLVESRAGAGIQGQVASDLYETDAMIGPLADNGGPTMTHALLAGSPAIDAGMTDFETDQRGELRADPDDIGSYDFGDGMMAGDGVMLITGVFDGNLPGGTPKAVEFYVSEDIADLGLFGFGSANNGGGSDGEEFSFPDGVAASAGDYLYLAANADDFQAFFGFAPDYTSGAAGINGDDAVELFMNDVVVDTYGDIDVNGDGEPWDYTDGWAYRMDGTGPDGTAFVVGNFTYSGIDENDDDTTQAGATNPWPIGTYANESIAPGGVASAFGDADVTTSLAPVTPNPIRSAGRVRFTVERSEAVEVALYDVMGRRVQTLYTGTPAAEATVDVTVDASALASGVYVVVLQSATVRQTQRVTVAR